MARTYVCDNCGSVVSGISKLVFEVQNGEEIVLCRACSEAYKTCPTCLYRSVCGAKTVTNGKTCENCICGNGSICNKQDKLTCDNYKCRWARL